MITVGMNYNVKPGKQQEFEQKFDAVLVAIRSATGHVTSKLFQDVADDTAYLIVSEWSEQDRFVEFIRSAAFKGAEKVSGGKGVRNLKYSRTTDQVPDTSFGPYRAGAYDDYGRYELQREAGETAGIRAEV